MTRRTIPIVPAGTPSAGEAPRLVALPPLALYVHFPWCVKKCPYCDFNSHEARGGFPEDEYVAALITDLEQALPAVWGRPVVSVFIGGGTPSLLSPRAVDSLLSAVRARLPLAPEAEITLEANPGTVDMARFAGYRQAGVNRLSLGVQSLNPRHLAALGRIHDGRQARAAIEAALTHFDNVNLDLMYALPEQTLEEARADIREAAAYGTPHLSAYHLTLEPNTAFAHAPPPVPDADLAAAMQDAVEEILAWHGYGHYEVSAFARPGSECRHNLNYWLFGDYLGIGAGAHGKLSFPGPTAGPPQGGANQARGARPEGARTTVTPAPGAGDGGRALVIVREMRHRHPDAYLRGVAAGRPMQEAHEVKAEELPFEFMMNALRLTVGFPARLFAERTGLPLAAIRGKLNEAQTRGLIEQTAQRIAPTERGRRFLNDLLQIFLG